MIKDLKHVTVEQVLTLRSEAIRIEAENQKLEQENAELRASVERLRGQFERFGLGIDESHRNICNKLVNKTPSQHLNDIKADAVESILNDVDYSCETPNGDDAYSGDSISDYAQQLREGE